jgi:hypothetical protein
MDDLAATPHAAPAVMPVIDRALLTAQLLTGSLEQAEKAVLEAIDWWNPSEEPEVLFHRVVEAAARQSQEVPASSEASRLHLPNELKAVLRLAPQPRNCFVLRILLGLGTQGCARLLRSNSKQVEDYTRAALQGLAAS